MTSATPGAQARSLAEFLNTDCPPMPSFPKGVGSSWYTAQIHFNSHATTSLRRFAVLSRRQAMHPPLIPHLHPLCGKYMEALSQCHKEHNISKWWGACNDVKQALTTCLAEEKKIVRAERQEAARRRYREQRQQREQQQQEQQQQQQQQDVQ